MSEAGSGSHRRASPTTLPADGSHLMRAGSGDSLDGSRSGLDGSKKGLGLGNSLLSEARRVLKGDKKDGKRGAKGEKAVTKKWDVVRQNLLGPQGPTMRASLSGNYKTLDDLISANDAARSGGASNRQLQRPPLGLPATTSKYGAVDAVGLAAAEEGVVLPRVPSPPPPKALEQEGEEGGQKLTVGLVWRAVKQVVMGRALNVLLLLMPFAALSAYLGWGAGPTFILNFLILLPLAAMLGDFTEEVAEHLGETIGGLVNASFGNAMEMVIGVQALAQGEIRVVQASMLGSILSNLLLVTGSCFLVGGLIHREQRFNSVAGVANLSLLFLATLALVVPTPIGKSYNLSLHDVLLISRVAACFLLSMYLQLIVFQLVTHRHLFEGDEEEGETASLLESTDANGDGAVLQLSAVENGAAVGANGNGNGNGNGGHVGQEGGEEGVVRGLVRRLSSSLHHHLSPHDDEDDASEDGEPPVDLGLWGSMAGLCLVALIVSCFSELLVDSIDGMSQAYGVSKTFVGVILLPLVGNATEHMTAVTVAAKNRMELAMGIAVGSATQVALFVVPFLVLSGWAMDKDMSLEFPPIEVVILFMSVVLTMPVLLNAQSNWLIGSLLITCYCFCAFAFWFEQPGPAPGTRAANKDIKLHG